MPKFEPRPEGEDEQRYAGTDDEGHKLYWCGSSCRYPHPKVTMVSIPEEDTTEW